jgi:hypothetical protein
MLVKSQCIGNRVTGLVVGQNNVRRYFPRNVKAINLKLDHLMIECGLTAGFWDGEPEIHDPRLCLWLESKQSRESNCRASLPFSMVPTGEGAFSLGFAELQPRSKWPRSEVRPSDLKFALNNSGAGAAA